MAYIHIMHGTAIQLAPMTEKDADTVCAELIKQVACIPFSPDKDHARDDTAK